MVSITGRVAVALLVTLALAVGAAPVTAQSDQPAWADDLFADLQDMQSRYNANVTDAEMNFAERQVYNQLKGNVVNVYFVNTDVAFSFYMRPDGTIGDLRQSRRDDASLKMEMTRGTAEELVARDNPVPPFVDAVRTGKRTGGTVQGIVINGEDGKIVKQATWTVINTVKGLL
ncbi:hypothetical protein [Haloplanus aerogenes]|uniref:Uncharacterized protein n=1 Tax=Haloplanus aerogenes TaxID=660522 RepID=A0A3M0DC75_9EURY|nr:hypothetical protein [Haloplanus aerogenes]AZH27096.1 hypothetical protein DU502_17705 [Haloplanus aerogenes]RMB13403.1 hypothetical protein ATH50_2736 [Haloplanus aerogenes]